MGDYDINFDSDNDYIRNLPGRSYMAAVSPWFFTVSCICYERKICYQTILHTALRPRFFQQEFHLPLGRLAVI